MSDERFTITFDGTRWDGTETGAQAVADVIRGHYGTDTPRWTLTVTGSFAGDNFPDHRRRLRIDVSRETVFFLNPGDVLIHDEHNHIWHVLVMPHADTTERTTP